MGNKKALIIDTTGDTAVICLYVHGEYQSFVSEKGAKRHTPVILNAIHHLMTSMQITPKELDEIACVVGPGSFTGIRVGVATAEGLAAATGAKRIAMTSLEIFADDNDALVVLDCKHDNFYALKRQDQKDEYLNLTRAELLSFRLPIIQAEGANPEGMVRVFLEKSARREYVEQWMPFYLKSSSAERNL